MSMLTPRLDWLLQCTGCSGCDNHHGQAELQIQLSTDLADHNTKHAISRADSFDITFTPRSFGTRSNQMTPRQRDIKETLELPMLHAYPVPPNSTSEEPEEERQRKLLEMYQEFALDLHAGMYLTQLTSNRDYSDIHCQLMEDMQTLKLDQSNGRIIEFPLTGVSKVYRIVKNDDKWYSAGSSVPGFPSSNTEHIVVVEFMRRKLAFVFKELHTSQRFLMCMELLIRRAQQKQAKKALRSLTPALPRQQGARPNSGGVSNR
mmetsp:Transcript_6345/g.10739  ORF Transcript_6345/g.10739 Transcript_6345/m.10739 type:complete len:261 (+) Transcript_6345:103-885(+)